jgi:hypothetical protein
MIQIKQLDSTHLQTYIVPFDISWYFQKFSRLLIMEAASTRTQDARGDESRHTTSHVDHAASSNVQDAHTQKRIGVVATQETMFVPNGMDGDRVDPT